MYGAVETVFINNRVNHYNIVCMWSMYKSSLLVLVVWSQVMRTMYILTISSWTTPPLVGLYTYICKSNEEFYTREREGERKRDGDFILNIQSNRDFTTHSDRPSLLTASLGRRPGTRGPSVSKLLRNWMVFTTKAFTWCVIEIGF